jgi:hypothetical protein
MHLSKKLQNVVWKNLIDKLVNDVYIIQQILMSYIIDWHIKT